MIVQGRDERESLTAPTSSLSAPPSVTEASPPLRDTLFQLRCERELGKARDVADFTQRVLTFINEAGFTDFFFLRLPKPNRTPVHIGTLSSEFDEFYARHRLWDHDLVLQYAEMNSEPTYQSVFRQYVDSAPFVTETIAKNRKIHEFCKNQGFADCYVIPLSSCGGDGRALLTVTSKLMDAAELRRQVERSEPMLQMLGQAIDTVGVRKFPDFFLKARSSHNIVIHPRPLQLLTTLAKKNTTLAGAATELCISVSTANKQIAAARAALGANTTASAIYRAIKAGIIEIDPDE